MSDDEEVCRLCLRTICQEVGYAPLTDNDTVLGHLKLIFDDHGQNLELTDEPLICNLCVNQLEYLTKFKLSILSNDEKLAHNQKVDLTAYLKCLADDIKNICRLCLISSSEFSKTVIEFDGMLDECYISLNKQVERPVKICQDCIQTLQIMKEFVSLTTSNEKLIRELADKQGKLSSKDMRTVSLAKLLILDGKINSDKPTKKVLNQSTFEPVQEMQLTKSLMKYEKRKKPIEDPMEQSLSELCADVPSTSKDTVPIIMSRKILMDKMNDQLSSTSVIDLEAPEDNSRIEFELGLGIIQECCEVENGTTELIGVFESLKDDCTENANELLGLLDELDESTDTHEENVPTAPMIEEPPAPVPVQKKRGRPKRNQIEPPAKQLKVEEMPKKRTRTSTGAIKPSTIASLIIDDDSNDKESQEDNDDDDDDDFDETLLRKAGSKQKQLTIWKAPKKTNKAQLDKTWQELTGKAVASTSAPGPVEITKVRYRGPKREAIKKSKEAKKATVWLFCDVCPFKTYTQNSFTQHQLIHSIMSNMPVLYCDQCRFTTTESELMQTHKASHESANLSYKCVFCDETFKRKTSCMYHTLRHDDKDVASQFYCLVSNGTEDEDYFECYQCSYQSVDETSMPDHIIDHTIEIPKLPLVARFKCDECSYRTKTEEMLVRHKLLHEERRRKKKGANRVDDETPIEIKIERDNAEDGTHLVEPKPLLQCHKCHYMTRNKRSLSNHFGLKHNRAVPPIVSGEAAAAQAQREGKTMYYCNECSYSTYRKLNMPRHMVVHKTRENMEMFECPHCIFETKHRRSYTRHMETKHMVII